MLRRNVEGLIIIRSYLSTGDSLLLAHKFDRMLIVTLDRPIEGSGFDSLLVENEEGARLRTDHLIALGHKRITYVGLSDDLFTISMRQRGYQAARESAGLKASAAICTSSDAASGVRSSSENGR